jgi:hypothetical protein
MDNCIDKLESTQNEHNCVSEDELDFISEDDERNIIFNNGGLSGTTTYIIDLINSYEKVKREAEESRQETIKSIKDFETVLIKKEIEYYLQFRESIIHIFKSNQEGTDPTFFLNIMAEEPYVNLSYYEKTILARCYEYRHFFNDIINISTKIGGNFEKLCFLR